MVSLDGFWDFGFVGELDEYPGAERVKFTTRLPVPGCFDVEPQFKLRRGVGVYRTRVVIGGPVTLIFEGLGPKAEILWDGKTVGRCDLPFSREEFRFDAGGEKEHTLLIAVDNRADDSPDSLFPGFYDFYRHGGIYRPVSICRTPDWEIAHLKVIPRDIVKGIAGITVELAGNFPAEAAVSFSFDGKAPVRERLSGGRGTFALAVPDFRLWSPEDPHLHRLTVTVGEYVRKTTFGMRIVEAKQGRLFVNGKPVKLLGYNRHDCHPDFGYAVPEALVKRDLELIKAQGCNFIRGCHYPQSETVLDWCDRLGIFFWEESIGWGNTEPYLTSGLFRARQREQTRRMARKSVNHPCVILQGFMNELRSNLESGRTLIRELAAILKEEDGSRPVTFACDMPFEDISMPEVDVLSFNLYPGWYWNPLMSDVQQFDPEGLKKTLRKYEVFLERPEFKEKPFIISEIGAAALPGWHGDVRWTEEYQADLTCAVFRYVLDAPRCTGVAIWMFCDTRSVNDYRIHDRPRGFNNKGLLDEYRRPKTAWNAVAGLLKQYPQSCDNPN
ncbi:MAG: hypothetical protein IJU70_10135 [Lentisphaeria bacterium]|nr:hypothetical protein [Lentisphaeria bacterium]